MRFLLMFAALMLAAAPAKAVVFAEDRYIATVDSANSSVKYGDRYAFGWDRVWGSQHPQVGAYQTANVTGLFGVTAEHSYDKAPAWQLYTQYETHLLFDNLGFALDNPAIGKAFEIPEMNIKVEEYTGYNPDFDPYYSYLYGAGIFDTFITVDLFPPILERISSIMLDSDQIGLTGNTGGGHFDEVFVFDLEASLALADTGEAADFEPLAWDDGTASNNSSVGPAAVPVPAGLLLFGPVLAVGAAVAVRQRRRAANPVGKVGA